VHLVGYKCNWTLTTCNSRYCINVRDQLFWEFKHPLWRDKAVPLNRTSSQNSVLLQCLCRRVWEQQLSWMQYTHLMHIILISRMQSLARTQKFLKFYFVVWNCTICLAALFLRVYSYSTKAHRDWHMTPAVRWAAGNLAVFGRLYITFEPTGSD
jgi:hypothetical protein